MHSFIILIRKNASTILVIVLVAITLTGNLGFIMTPEQSLLLKTGAMNANTDLRYNQEKFDYGFSVKDLKGNTVSLESLKGKVIFINLWATWCGPCRAEMPTIQKLYNEIDHDKIAFVMLSLDKEGDEQKVINYIEKKEFTFPVYTRLSPLPSLLKVPSIPTTFVISKDGYVISQNVGTTNFNTKKFKNFLLEENSR